MVKYIIIHNKHEGCYDFQYYEDAATKMRLTSITINPPKLFMFDTRDQAQDFFEEYINDVDVIDVRCKKNDEVEHIDYCTCGIIELDEEENPILFYNKKNQIFLLEHGSQVFLPPYEVKEDIKNLNLTNRLIRRAKSLSREQRKRYIELGKYCEECSINDKSDDEEEDPEKADLQKQLREQQQLQELLQKQLFEQKLLQQQKLEYQQKLEVQQKLEAQQKLLEQQMLEQKEKQKLEQKQKQKQKLEAEQKEKQKLEVSSAVVTTSEPTVTSISEPAVSSEAETKKKPVKRTVKKTTKKLSENEEK